MTYPKTAALARMKANVRLAEILAIEPALQVCIDIARDQHNVPGYSRPQVHRSLYDSILSLVGPKAKEPQVRSAADFEVVMNTIGELLPLDNRDLVTLMQMKVK